ncbi:hypothetical protein [uncultured Sphingomonas sp.]|uniref:hypothetical protein n=1 Tax=uncultured Sphingomonas sp. TaxID=158754 RepID=UPI0035CB891A
MADDGDGDTPGHIAALISSRNDSAGNAIREFYACNPPAYAVYRTDARVMIAFADKGATERVQRAKLAPLGPLRSEINGLIDGWRSSRDHRRLAKARTFDRRTADAIVMALEDDDVSNATIELNAVRNAIIDGRKSAARFLYLITAFVVALALIVLVAIASLPGLGLLAGWGGANDVLIATVGGVAGSFYSIATGLSKRTILTDLQQRDNAQDAILRMLIGFISAGIVICVIHSGVGVQIVPQGVDHAWMQLVTLGFLAGFSERLVPDLLAKAGAAVEATPLPNRDPLRVAQPTPAAKTDPGGGPPVHVDGDCASDVPLAESDATPDAALPAAAGGVQ